MTRQVLPFLCTLALVGIGCAAEPAADSNVTNDDLTQARLDVSDVASRAECLVANGWTSVETFDVATFEAAKGKAKLSSDMADRGCPAHGTSTSREDAISKFKAWLAMNDEEVLAESCGDVDPSAPEKLKADLLALVEDPTNKAVFSAIPVDGSNDDEVNCYVFRFVVYRADGKVVTFNFDWSA